MQRLKIYYSIVLSLGLVCSAHGICAVRNPTPPVSQDISFINGDQVANIPYEVEIKAVQEHHRRDRVVATAAAIITARKYGYNVQTPAPPRMRVKNLHSVNPLSIQSKTTAVHRKVQPRLSRTTIKKTVVRKPTRTRPVVTWGKIKTRKKRH